MLRVCWEPNPRDGKCCGASSVAMFPGAWPGYPWFSVGLQHGWVLGGSEDAASGGTCAKSLVFWAR